MYLASDAFTLLILFLALDSPHVVLEDKYWDTLSPNKVQGMQHIGPEVSSQRHNAVASNEVKECTMENQEEDSFVDAIRSRTPARPQNTGSEYGLILADEETGLADSKNPQHRGDLSGQEQGPEDSFVGKIITRSPAKLISRIEDSVEAIDAFEEEMEKIGELMPTISDTMSPFKEIPKKNPASIALSKPKSCRAEKSKKIKALAGIATPVRQHNLRRGEVSAKVNEDAKHNASKKAPPTAAKRISSIHKTPFQPAKSTKLPTRPIFDLPGEAVARKLKDKREERLRNENEEECKKVEVKSVLRPVKSTKPLTHPTFELPGDSIARKLKEQREIRLKQQEADAEPKKAFKARPVRASEAPVVKSTATSKARMSLARESTQSKNIHNRAPNIRPASKRPASVSLGDANQRPSTLSVPKRTHAALADPSARTTRGPSLTATSLSRLSLSVATQRVTPNGNGAHQSIRGREVFERNKTLIEELDRLRKEKEEAAKKARVEAAERGRLASRQWAEKQKARKLSAETEKGAGRNVARADA